MIRLLGVVNSLIRPEVSILKTMFSNVRQISTVNAIFSSEQGLQACPPYGMRSHSVLITKPYPRQYSRLSYSPVDFCQKIPSSILSNHSFGYTSNRANPLALYRPRLFSTSASVNMPRITSLFENGVEFIQSIEDPKQRMIAWSVLTIGLISLGTGSFVLAKKLYEEQKKGDIKTSPPDLKDLPLEIVELQQFVTDFNEVTNTNPTQVDSAEAFKKIQHWRFIGKLFPRIPDNGQLDSTFAMRGILELFGCNDRNIQALTLSSLIRLLNLPLNTMDLIGPLCSLIEYRLWMILNSSEVEHPTPIMEALVTAHRLVLQRIYEHCVGGGRKLDSKAQIEQRAHEIGLKLEGNIEFQYQSIVARSIASNLPITDQAAMNTLDSIGEIVKVFREADKDAEHLLNQEIVSFEFIEGLIGLLKNSANYSGRLESAYRTIKEAYQGDQSKPINFIPLKVDHRNLEANLESIKKSLELFREKQDIVGVSQSDWIHLYGLVEMLCRIADSNAENEVRIQALQSLTSLISEKTSEAVLFKIAAFLLSIRNDPLLTLESKKQFMILEPIALSKDRITLRWNWVKANADSLESTDRQIREKTEFTPPSGSKIERMFDRPAFQNDLVIEQRPVFSSVFKIFQQSPPSAKTIKQVIWGQGGTGKTTFVTDFIKKYGKIYSEIYWIDSLNFDLEIEKMAEEIGISSQGDDLLNSIRVYLEEHPGWLIIFDNVDYFERSTLVGIKQILPASGGHVLVTTRFPGNDWDGFKEHKLESIHREESIFYLLSLTNDNSEKDVGEVADRLGDLPLALSQAAAWMKVGRKSFSEFIRVFDEKKEDLKHILPSEGNQSVMVTWATNLERVQEDHPFAAELISFLSFIYPKEIHFDLIGKWKDQFFSKLREKDLSDALTQLSQRMMIEKPSKRDDGKPVSSDVYQFHSLNQEYMRRLLSEEDWIKYAKQTIDLLTSFEEFRKFNPVRHKTFRDFEQLKPHFEALIRHIDLKDKETLTRLEKLDECSLEKFQYLANTVFRYHLRIGKNFEFAEQCVNYVGEIAKVFHKKGLTLKESLYTAWHHYLNALLLQKLSAENMRRHNKLNEWKQKELKSIDECGKVILESLLMLAPSPENKKKFEDLLELAKNMSALSKSDFRILISDTADLMLRESRANKLKCTKEFKSALDEFTKLNEGDFQNHMLESNVEKWNKTYAITICRFEALVAKGYPSDKPEELTPLIEEYETLITQFESAAALSWHNLRSSGEKWEEEMENRKIQNKDLDTNTFRFDVPRCMREQAKMLGIQREYPKARQLMLDAIEEQKKMYRATVDADFETTPASSVSYHELAEICFKQAKYDAERKDYDAARTDYDAAREYETESRKINMSIYKDKQHPYILRNDAFIEICDNELRKFLRRK